jgi:hypothetical protein
VATNKNAHYPSWNLVKLRAYKLVINTGLLQSCYLFLFLLDLEVTDKW